MSLKNKIQIFERRLLTDERGWFVKALTGQEDGLPNYTGEIYLTSAKPQQAKGGHYHPKAQEWFTLVAGEAILSLKDIETGETLDLELSANLPKTIYVPPMVAHIFTNSSATQDFILIAYTDMLYDPKDTIAYKV